jgi:hypothetical protein
LDGSLQTELLTFFKCDGLVTDRKCRIRCEEKTAIDPITVIYDDFLERRDHKLLELAKCEFFDPSEIPIVCEF